MSALLAAEGLVFGHGRPLARPLSFTLEAGRVTTLVGPNGVGKSTLLRALGEPRLRLGGALRARPGLRLGHLAQAADGLAGLPLSARELLALTGAGSAGLPPWLADCLDARIDRLSGGQQQYLRLWSVAAAPFDCLLLDEPSNNLDARGVAALVDWLAAPHPERAVLLVTHDEALIDPRRQTLIHLEAP